MPRLFYTNKLYYDSISSRLENCQLSMSQERRPRTRAIVKRCTTAPEILKNADPAYRAYLCQYCGELLKKPLLTKCCSDNVCSYCLLVWQQSEHVKSNSERKCPLCDELGFKYHQNVKLEQRMKDTVIPCKNSFLGCPWSGLVAQLSEHLEAEDGCLYVSQTCPHKCGKLVRRNLLIEHLLSNLCVQEWEKCEHCSNIFPTVESHSDATCPSYLLSCPNQCGVTVKRSQLPQHEKECPLAVVDCPFKEAGCSTSQMQRKESAHHLNQDHVQHLLSAFQYLQTELSSLKSQLQSTQDDQRAMTKELQKTKREFTAAKLELEKQKIGTEVLATTFRTELGYFHPSCSCEAFALECANTRLGMLTNRSTAFLHPNSTALTFRLTNYSTLKKNNLPWYSPPFYIREGYKMCIAVHLNGDQEGKGTHISVHIHLMAGEYDTKLKWPLAYSEEITISMMKLHNLQQTKAATMSSHAKFWGSPVVTHKHARRHSKSDPGGTVVTQDDDHPLPQQIVAVEHTIQSLVFNLYCIQKPLDTIGLPFGSIALFCTQNCIDSSIMCKDSLVFQIAMHRSQNTI